MTAAPESQYDVSPSDLGQSVFRVALVSIIAIWTYVVAFRRSGEWFPPEANFRFALVYLALSLVIFVWTFGVLRQRPSASRLFTATRVISVFTDVGAVSVYTGLSGEDGVILYPIYLTCIIGYGYRFGLRYLYLTLAVSASTFALALMANDYLASSGNLIAAYYLSILIVPIYATSLLKQHRLVLDKIREVNAARSRFIANMSHELRTPLHAIISVSDLLGEDLEQRPDERDVQLQKVRMIGDSGQHLLDLVNRVLDMASADAGGVGTVRLANLELKQVLLSSIRICQPNAEKKRLRFFWFYDLDLPQHIESSAEYLQEIVINTVGNAIKYTQEGHVQVSMTLSGDAAEPRLRLEIADTGIGISPKLLPTIFEPFTLGDDSAARRYSGTGLGLTLTKKFVDDLGGTIEFDSVERIGTRCIIILPLRPVDSGDVVIPALISPTPCLVLSPGQPRESDQAAFEDAGYRCSWAQNTGSLVEAPGPGPVVFVDARFGADLEHTVRQIAEARAGALICLYGADPGQQAAPLMVNTRVPRGEVAALRAARELVSLVFDFEQAPAVGLAVPVSVTVRHILVADDNPTNLKTAQLALETQGHKVSLARNGEEALAALESHAFDIAFIDLHMPSMSGIEVTQIYQYLITEHRTPIVILTADATTAASKAAEEAGATAFLTKPLRAAEMRRAVQQYARGQEAEVIALSSMHPTRESDSTSEQNLIQPEVMQEFLDLGIEPQELIEMIDQFETDSMAHLETLAGADRNSAGEVLHSMKGASATVGAEGVRAETERVMNVLRSGEAIDLGRQAAVMRDLLRDSCSALKDFVTAA